MSVKSSKGAFIWYYGLYTCTVLDTVTRSVNYNSLKRSTHDHHNEEHISKWSKMAKHLKIESRSSLKVLGHHKSKSNAQLVTGYLVFRKIHAVYLTYNVVGLGKQMAVGSGIVCLWGWAVRLLCMCITSQWGEGYTSNLHTYLSCSLWEPHAALFSPDWEQILPIIVLTNFLCR